MAAERWARWPILVLAGVGALLTIGLVGLLATAMWMESGWHRRPVAEVRATGRTETYAIGAVEPIAKTPFVRITVIAAGSGGGGSYSGRAEDMRNVILLDSRSGASRRLLPDNSAHLAESWYLPATPTDPSRGSRGLPDSDGDEPLAFVVLLVDHGETQSVVAGRIDGGGTATVLRDVDGVDAIWTRDTGHLALLVREHRRLFFRIVDSATWRVTASRAVEIGA